MAGIKKNSHDLQDIQDSSQITDDYSFFQKVQQFDVSDFCSGLLDEPVALDGFQIMEVQDFSGEMEMAILNEESEMTDVFVNKGDEFTESLPINDEKDADYLVIGCRLPNGLVIRIRDQTILLRGIKDMPGRDGVRSYGGIGFTRVLKSLWNEFLKNHSEWLPLQNGSVFVSGNSVSWLET